MPRVAYPMLSISMDREMIEVDTLVPETVPDMRWRFVDAKGHGHFWDADEKLPTLEWVVTGTRVAGDEYESFEYEVGEYRCRICGEPVQPGKSRRPPGPVPGLAKFTVSIGDESFVLSEDEYADAVAKWLSVLRESAARREP